MVGVYYYFSLKTIAIQKAELENELSTTKIREHISLLLTERMRNIDTFADINEWGLALKEPNSENITEANSMLMCFNKSPL